MGVLNVRQGDGTYVAALESATMFDSAGYIAELMQDRSVLEAYQLRRLLEPAATATAAKTLKEDELGALKEQIIRVESASSIEELVEADIEFHDTIVSAAGNGLIASVLRAVSSRSVRARIWRGLTDQKALERTHQGHYEIYEALEARDPERAHAAALLHIAEGEDWLKHLIQHP
jgi:GntR family transcriptional repressor for pyruvate dehydrogenase complex